MAMSNAEKTRRYRERHPEKFKESLRRYWGKKYECPCGLTVTMKNRKAHFDTENHLIRMEYQALKRKFEQQNDTEITPE